MSAAVELLQAKFPNEVVEGGEFRGETTIVVKPGPWWTSFTALRDGDKTSFRYLSMIAGLDFLPQSPRSQWVYNLYSHRYQTGHLKDFLADDAAAGGGFGGAGLVHGQLARTGSLRHDGDSLQRPPGPQAHPHA